MAGNRKSASYDPEKNYHMLTWELAVAVAPQIVSLLVK
jgi:hypothetical protein